MKSKTLSETIKELKAASSQDTQSTEFCPRHLLGHDIHPQEALQAVDYHRAEPSSAITAAFLCSGCGICELVSCEPRFLSPQKIYAEFKRRLTDAKIKNPHQRSGFSVHSQFENRKMPTPLLLKKLGLSVYEKKLAYAGSPKVSHVRIPLTKYWGTPLEATVHVGQTVRCGEMIAAPLSDEGSLQHASIHGTISNITEHFIEITGVPA